MKGDGAIQEFLEDTISALFINKQAYKMFQTLLG